MLFFKFAATYYLIFAGYITHTLPGHRSQEKIKNLPCSCFAILLTSEGKTQDLIKTAFTLSIFERSTIKLSRYNICISSKSRIKFNGIQSSRRGYTDESVNLRDNP